MIGESSYDVYALRYASRATQASEEFFRHGLYGEPDAPLRLDYFFWLVRNAHNTMLVDCGFDAARSAARSRFHDNDPIELLARMDVRPADVDHLILTHLHYDHCGNVGLFPNAIISVAGAELEAWSGSFGQHDLVRWVVDPVEVEMICELQSQGRVRLIDSEEDVIPGVNMKRVGGHTPGQSIVRVQTASGTVVLASDAMHYYAETELDRPYNLFTNLDEMYQTYDLLRELEGQPDTTLVAGHDPLVTTRFLQVAPECYDLAIEV